MATNSVRRSQPFAFLQLFRPGTTVVDQGAVKISFDADDHIVVRVVMGPNDDLVTEQEWEPFSYFAQKRTYTCGRGGVMLTVSNRAAGMSGTATFEAQFLSLYKLKTGELAVHKRDMRGASITVVPVQYEDTSAWYRFAPVAPSALPK